MSLLGHYCSVLLPHSFVYRSTEKPAYLVVCRPRASPSLFSVKLPVFIWPAHVPLFGLRLRLSTYSKPQSRFDFCKHFFHTATTIVTHRQTEKLNQCLHNAGDFLFPALCRWLNTRFIISDVLLAALIAECLSRFRLNCSHHCVVTDKGGAACRCPLDQALRSDNVTCYPLGEAFFFVFLRLLNYFFEIANRLRLYYLVSSSVLRDSYVLHFARDADSQ